MMSTLHTPHLSSIILLSPTVSIVSVAIHFPYLYYMLYTVYSPNEYPEFPIHPSASSTEIESMAW
jgi:hypothetical protein